MGGERQEAERILGELEEVLEAGPSADDCEAVGLDFVARYRPWAEVGRRALELLKASRAAHHARNREELGPLEAWEIDAGPGGIYWELGTLNDQGTMQARPGNVATRAEAEAAGARVFHTLEQWHEEQAEAEAAERIAELDRQALTREHGDAYYRQLDAAEPAPDMAGWAAETIEAEAEAAELEAGRDRFGELEARVSRLERLANDERTGKAER